MEYFTNVSDHLSRLSELGITVSDESSRGSRLTVISMDETNNSMIVCEAADNNNSDVDNNNSDVAYRSCPVTTLFYGKLALLLYSTIFFHY